MDQSSSSTTEIQSSIAAITPEGDSCTRGSREESLVMIKHEERLELYRQEKRYDSEIFDFSHCLHHGNLASFLLESPLKAHVPIMDEIVEHTPGGPANNEVYASSDSGNGCIEDVKISISVTSLDNTCGMNA